MNSKSSNEKIIRILSEMRPIHDETEEEKKAREKMEDEAMKNVSEEAPLAFPRKAAGVICIALWLFSVVALMFGFGDIGVLLPFMLLALAAVCGLNIPVFLKKGKIFDIAAAIIACAVCVFFSVEILVMG